MSTPNKSRRAVAPAPRLNRLGKQSRDDKIAGQKTRRPTFRLARGCLMML